MKEKNKSISKIIVSILLVIFLIWVVCQVPSWIKSEEDSQNAKIKKYDIAMENTLNATTKESFSENITIIIKYSSLSNFKGDLKEIRCKVNYDIYNLTTAKDRVIHAKYKYSSEGPVQKNTLFLAYILMVCIIILNIILVCWTWDIYKVTKWRD